MSSHPFELAGLGIAPFRVIGCYFAVGPIQAANGTMIGAPGQPMGCCAFCGQGIKECWQIRSADKKVFTVGCDCVRKTAKEYGDTTLARDQRRLQTKRNHDRDDARIARALALVEAMGGALGDILEATEGTSGVYPDGRPWSRTAWSIVYWDLIQGRAGRAWKVKAARLVEQAVASLSQAKK